MINLKQENFEAEFNTGKSYIQFSAAWCGPCKSMTSAVKNIEKDFSDIKFYKVDIEEYSQEYLQRFEIKSVPKVILVDNGNIVDEYLGSKQLGQIVKILNGFLENK